ncbi:MAG TPA: hypothetical protein VN969_28600 [Streptosporangiaceae bacterium]|nr:hypothetical protein [Streptosporangiaceae bacterium]
MPGRDIRWLVASASVLPNAEKSSMVVRLTAAAGALPVEAAHQQARQGHQDPNAPRDSHRPSTYRIAELLGSLQGEGRPVADFLPRLTFTVLLRRRRRACEEPGHLALSRPQRTRRRLRRHPQPLPGRPDRLQPLAIDGSFDHRRISATHLIREAEHWNALGTGEPEQLITATLADFAKALDHVTVPSGVPAATLKQLAWNLERLEAEGDRVRATATCCHSALVDPY